MYIKIWPWKPGDRGLVCMPLKKNIPYPNEDGEHEDWIAVTCPICGSECWESDLSRKLVQIGNVGVCTECAIREGMCSYDEQKQN